MTLTSTVDFGFVNVQEAAKVFFDSHKLVTSDEIRDVRNAIIDKPHESFFVHTFREAPIPRDLLLDAENFAFQINYSPHDVLEHDEGVAANDDLNWFFDIHYNGEDAEESTALALL